MVLSIPEQTSHRSVLSKVSVFLVRSVFDWPAGNALAGRELLDVVPDDPVLISAHGKIWIGKVRPEGAWLKVFPEGKPPFKVRSEQAQLFAITESSRPPDCYYECDLQGRTLNTSASLNRLFGLSAREMEGDGWLNAISGTALERMETASIWQSAIEARSLYRSAYTVQHQESGLLIPCRTLATMAMRHGRPVYRGIVFPC